MREGINTVESNLAKIMVSASDAESGILAAQNHRAASEALDSLGRLPIKRENTVKQLNFSISSRTGRIVLPQLR